MARSLVRENRETIPKAYNPRDVESTWYDFWKEHGFFHEEADAPGGAFCIVMPPPNVTGSLHLGHALDMGIQDILARWRRMQKWCVLWLPGMDHAGIATQVKVEDQLRKEGISRQELGRERFLERAWKWKEQYGGEIMKQLHRMGASCDWERERFTMDEGCSRAVRQVFVTLYNEGLVYQGNYIVNWCPRCHTALSDLEVDHEETRGKLYYVSYPFADGPGSITVATTRPETILGDTAVAVNPGDPRYVSAVGKEVVVPVVKRKVPVVADDYADPRFGTGAVKVTPAHDPSDFEAGRRNGLASVVVIDQEGRMTEEAGPFAGMDRYECRQAMVNRLHEEGLLVKVEDYTHAVGQCQRCATVVEPLVSRQWFLAMKPLAEPALQAARDGRVRFVPDTFRQVYINWLENIHDWCISRQLWWGHRIPVYTCSSCGKHFASVDEPGSCPGCGSAAAGLAQDPDVLDTWFSSALWPFSTLGWPGRTADLARFYPTTVLVTGYDILFFWVARMIFMGLKFMGEVPFRDVLLHGLIRNKDGRKMSRSLGTGVDPIQMIDRYGSDALRFALVTGNAMGGDIRFSTEKVEGYRNFANKVWNAARFTLMNLEGLEGPEGPDRLPAAPADGDQSLAERWITSRLSRTVEVVTARLEEYDVGEATRVLYDFIWSEFCDWYIELAKARVASTDPRQAGAARYTLWRVLRTCVELLHPFMPFLTEEVWQSLPHEGESVMVAAWPRPEEFARDPAAEQDMTLIMNVVRAVRNMRAEVNLPPGQRARAVAVTEDVSSLLVLEANAADVKHLAALERLELASGLEAKPSRAPSAVESGIQLYLPLEGLLDIDREVARLSREIEVLEGELARYEGRLADPAFIERAPAEVVQREMQRRAEFQAKRDHLARRVRELSGGD